MGQIFGLTPWLRLTIGAIGVIVILTGVFRVFIEFIKDELTHKNEALIHERGHERRKLGSYLLLGLEFLVAADIVQTILRPTLEDLGLLAMIVAIRIVFSYFIRKEMEEIS